MKNRKVVGIMFNFLTVVGAAAELPTFPTVDITKYVDWLVNGFTGLVSNNAALVVGASISMTLLPIGIKKVKRFVISALS